jgi:acetate kinase
MQVRDAILVLNSGSSSLKFGVFSKGERDEELLLQGSAEGIARQSGSMRISAADGGTLLKQDGIFESQQDALQKLAAAMHDHLDAAPVAVGHRIVHGGPRLREHQRITPNVLAQLEAAIHFAPLHIPQALKLVREAEQIFPDCPHFACFDNAFHRTMPEVACHLPLPTRYYEQGVIRYGFHGLSCESIVHRLGSRLPKRAVFAHLGNGASVTAVLDGKSIDTSMGLTPTGGVPMGTRSGDLDPGVLLYLMRTESMDADHLETLLNHDCGLAGFSNGESDMQALLQRAHAQDASAELAVAAFSIAVRKYTGAYAALLGGIDLLVFTGGIGEHSEEIRRRACDGLGFLGISTAAGHDSKVIAMKTEEERQIARHSRKLLQPS